MSHEREPSFETPEQISQLRIERLKGAVEAAIQELPPEETSKVTAVLVYGSTALGMAKESSDVDGFIAFESGNQPSVDTLKHVMAAMTDAVPETMVSFNFGGIGVRSRGSRSIVVPSTKHPERKPRWVYLYSRDEATQRTLDSNLIEAQHFYEKLGLNQPPRRQTEDAPEIPNDHSDGNIAQRGST